LRSNISLCRCKYIHYSISIRLFLRFCIHLPQKK
jgi:hypothetical protein